MAHPADHLLRGLRLRRRSFRRGGLGESCRRCLTRGGESSRARPWPPAPPLPSQSGLRLSCLGRRLLGGSSLLRACPPVPARSLRSGSCSRPRLSHGRRAGSPERSSPPARSRSPGGLALGLSCRSRSASPRAPGSAPAPKPWPKPWAPPRPPLDGDDGGDGASRSRRSRLARFLALRSALAAARSSCAAPAGSWAQPTLHVPAALLGGSDEPCMGL